MFGAKYERPMYYYPDVYGRNNCIYFNGYYQWMTSNGYDHLYLFSEASDCCSYWYPGRDDCPDLTKPTETNIDGNPNPVTGYWYPNKGEGSCQFGRNYPQYMAQLVSYPVDIMLQIFCLKLYTHYFSSGL